MKGGGFLGVHYFGRGQLRETRSTSTAPPAISRSTFPRQHQSQDLSVLQHAFTSLRSSTVKTLDRKTSWAPRRDSIKASAPPFKEPPFLSTPSFWEWVAASTTITRWSLLRSWVLILQELTILPPSFMFILSIPLPNLSIPDSHALSRTIINSHQETVSGQACNPPDPHWSFFLPIGGGVLQYPVLPRWWLLFLNVGNVHCLSLFLKTNYAGSEN